MKDPGYPLKPIELRITVNGFTWEEVLRALRERVETVEERREQSAGCSASGWGASHTCDIQLRDVTREQFTEESIAWLDAQHAKRRAEPLPESATPPKEPR